MPDEPVRYRRWSGLRARLTLSYAIFFTVILLGVGFLFHETLDYTLFSNTEQVLAEEWATIRAYLRLDSGRPVWKYDVADAEEAFLVRRLRRVFLLTGPDGAVLEVSPIYRGLGVETPAEVRSLLRGSQPAWRVRRDDNGVDYLIRSSVYYDEKRRPYFLAIGRGLDSNEKILDQFTFRYFAVLPALLLVVCAAGWVAAGRALRPLYDVGHVAQSLTGDNLHLRIPQRGAGDELDHLIAAFNSMVDRLESSFNQIRQFSTDVSHELRTPLTALRGQLEVALFTSQSAEQYRDAMLDAIANVEQLTKVVRTLLHLSQAESGQIALSCEAVNLSAAVRAVSEQFEVLAESKSISISSSLDERAVIFGDRIQVERLLSNLLGNAIKYTPDGGRVQLTAAARGRRAVLIVEDSGRGIAADHLPRIFDRLYRVPDGRVDPERGIGLGLSFVAWIAKAHHGVIHVDSKLGHGSKFEVSFPLYASRPDEPPRTKASIPHPARILE